MEWTVNRDGLRAAIAGLAAVAGPNGQMILDVADDGTAVLSAQRQRFQAWYHVTGVKGDAGKLGFDPKRLGPMLDKVSASDKKLFPDVYIEIDPEEFRVASSRSEWTMPRLHNDGATRPPEGHTGFRVGGPAFADLIAASLWAIDPNSTRYALGGMKIEADGENLQTVATDGRGMVIGSIPMDRIGNPNDPPVGNCTGWVTPVETLKLAAKLAAKSDTITARLASNQVEFRCDSGVVSSPTLEGRFPDWRMAVPDGKPTVEFPLDGDDGKEFLRMVQLVSITTSEEQRGVHLEIDPERFRVDAWSEAASVGRSHVDLPINMTGESVHAYFDPKFILSALGIMPLATGTTLAIHVAAKVPTLVVRNGVATVITSSMTTELKPRYLGRPGLSPASQTQEVESL